MKFVRALSLVSVALPLPAVVVLEACSSSSSGSTFAGPVAPSSGIQDSGPVIGFMGVGMGPSMGTTAAPEDGGDAEVAEGGGGIQAMDGSSDGSQDASDDGGGPHRGTPELPESFLALLA